MNFSIVKTILFKELLDTFRDKRTLLAMIGVPILLYPAIFIVAAEVTVILRTRAASQPSVVAVQGTNADRIAEWLSEDEQIRITEPTDSDSDLAAGTVDAIVSSEGELDRLLETGASAPIRIDYDATESGSRQALNRVEAVLKERQETLLEDRLASIGLNEDFINPLAIETVNAAPPEKTTGSLLGMILPLILVTMLGVGAFYPAIDLTAGEKERGTFETLLSTPVTKLEIIAGKFCTVLLLAVLTAMLNLASMMGTLLFQFSQIASRNDNFELGALEIAPQSVLAILIVLVPLALFIAAAMMAVSLLARSFKEATNYVSPFFIAIVLPATFAAIPEAELNATTQFIPITNAALLFRELMSGVIPVETVFTVMLCTTIYALLALRVAVWMFQREEVILSEERGIPLTFRRAEFEPLDVPTPGAALGGFAIVMLLIFYLGSSAQARNLHAGLLFTEYVLILLPVLAGLWFLKINIPKALNLHAPPLLGFLGTLLVAPAWVVLVVQLNVWFNKLLPLPDEFRLLAEQLFSGGETWPQVLWLLFVIAFAPAICEEALFRGTLLTALRPKLPGWAVVLILGILFGLFHMSIFRFAATGVTGLFLTYLALRTGSIIPAAIAHFTLNGLSVLVETGRLPAAVLEQLGEVETAGVPMSWLIAASVVFVLGVALTELGARKRK